MKTGLFVLFALATAAAVAQDTFSFPRYSLDPLFASKQRRFRERSLYDFALPRYDLGLKRQENVFDVFLNSRSDPFKIVNHRRELYRESFGMEFRNRSTEISFSSGTTSQGRTTSLGFGISW